MPAKSTKSTVESQTKPKSKPKPKPKTVKLDGTGIPGLRQGRGSSHSLLCVSHLNSPFPRTRASQYLELILGVIWAGRERLSQMILWVDIYQPATEADLAVHKKKVEDVRRWLLEAFEGGPSGKLKKYRRILALTGPAGTAKTATIYVLARELGFEILEWRNGVHVSESRPDTDGDHDGSYTHTGDNETLFAKFDAFMTRASACTSLFPPPASSGPHSQTPQSTSGGTRRRVILLEDLPNILHVRTQEQFHATLTALCTSASAQVPIVVVVSDVGTRGEARDEHMASGGGWGRKEAVLDVRSVLGELAGSQWVTQISYNPIAPTLLKRALQSLLSAHFSSTSQSYASQSRQPSKEVLDIVVASSNGDIRSAINALQFACIPGPTTSTSTSKRKKGEGKDKRDARVVLEAVTRRESSLALFHLMGKVLYNKRKGDAPGASRSKAETLYADSPIDSSLFSLFLHQNYPPFCTSIAECADLAEALSWADASGGETWYQANPAQFHLLALGTLHALPTPVERRGQVFCKPQFFEALRKEKAAAEAVGDVQGWLSAGADENGNGGRGWGKAEISTEFGGVFRARDCVSAMNVGSQGGGRGGKGKGVPASHRLFTMLGDAVRVRTTVLGEGDGADETFEMDEEANLGYIEEEAEAEEGGGWLETDDIEDF
ncbi:hypothetical protein FIBSPDRAFT_914983 [Athelia psychrophila]|uniref:Checkpoint protein RAD24-like helical bundle domain-containing protein n=1 Tax=Athelia psychrophila TaxID=1759441 RepID=A0A167VIM3_9AGAM|nr:hypothetical protein FIBSPDRAFT_914983 [Fibularhizoctonia sp. CBS 109695]